MNIHHDLNLLGPELEYDYKIEPSLDWSTAMLVVDDLKAITTILPEGLNLIASTPIKAFPENCLYHG